MAGYFRTIKVGAMPVTLINEGSGHWAMELDTEGQEWRSHVPGDTQGRVAVDFIVALIDAPGAKVLVDGGLGEPTPENLAQDSSVSMTRTPGLDAALADLGVGSETIDVVAITHAHGDHVQGALTAQNGGYAPRFPNARYLLGRDDFWNGTTRRSWDPLTDAWLDALHRSGQLDLPDREVDITPGVTFIPSPGESPGHGIIRVSSEGEVFYALGDLYHHPVEVSHPRWMPVQRDRTTLVASRNALAENALKENALLSTAHITFPGLGRLRRTGSGVEWVPVP